MYIDACRMRYSAGYYLTPFNTHSSILAWRIPWTVEPGGLQSWSLKELDTTEQLSLSLHILHENGTFSKAGLEGNFLNLIKKIFKKPTADIIFNGEKL